MRKLATKLERQIKFTLHWKRSEHLKLLFNNISNVGQNISYDKRVSCYYHFEKCRFNHIITKYNEYNVVFPSYNVMQILTLESIYIYLTSSDRNIIQYFNQNLDFLLMYTPSSIKFVLFSQHIFLLTSYIDEHINLLFMWQAYLIKCPCFT